MSMLPPYRLSRDSYYEDYLKLERWRIEAAMFLLSESDPRELFGDENALYSMENLVNDAIDVGTLKAYNRGNGAKPGDYRNYFCKRSDFIKWANSKDIPIPDPLKILLDKEDTPTTGEIPPYLDKKKYRNFFSEELAAAIETWLDMYGPQGQISKDKNLQKKPHRKIIDAHLDRKYPTFGKSQKERIAIMINARKAGASKTA